MKFPVHTIYQYYHLPTYLVLSTQLKNDPLPKPKRRNLGARRFNSFNPFSKFYHKRPQGTLWNAQKRPRKMLPRPIMPAPGPKKVFHLILDKLSKEDLLQQFLLPAVLIQNTKKSLNPVYMIIDANIPIPSKKQYQNDFIPYLALFLFQLKAKNKSTCVDDNNFNSSIFTSLQKFFRQFWTSSGSRPRLIGYNPQPGSVLIRAGNPVTARPYDPYVPPDPRLQRRSSWGWGK